MQRIRDRLLAGFSMIGVIDPYTVGLRLRLQ
jgi:hypothetical protein